PVAQRVTGGVGEGPVAAQVADPPGGRRQAQEDRGLRGHGGGHAGTAGWVVWLGDTASSVDARISARCTVRVPERSRDSPPPMCIRQLASPALQTSAWVESTLAILSVSIAVEVSAFFTAKVPPNPQHCSAAGSSSRVSPRTARS